MPEVTSHQPGAFCWVELGTSDLAAAKGFYASLFGWSSEDMPAGPGGTYTIFRLKGRDVAAGYQLDPAREVGVPTHWMLYVASGDVDATAKKSAALGGTQVMPPFDVMDLGRMTILKDPTGAHLSVWQAKKQPGLGISDEPGAFCWGQLNTTDTAKGEAFYTSLFGWDAKTGTNGAMTYTEFRRGGAPFGGMMAMPAGAPAPSHWLAYFAVADPDATAKRAAELGAATHVPPTSIPGAGRFAVFSDPQGAAFAIYRG